MTDGTSENEKSNPDGSDTSSSALPNESDSEQESLESMSQETVDPLTERRLKAPLVDKTKLDVDAVIDMAASAKSEHDAKLREELETRVPEPSRTLQPLANYRTAARCSSVCKNTTKEDRVNFCEQCRLRVYDFSEMERPEAEELIFKMEGRRDVILFKRLDGKFLTSDCPIGVRKKLINIAATAFGAATMTGLAALLLTQAPQTPAQAAKADVVVNMGSPHRSLHIATTPIPGSKSGASSKSGSTLNDPYSNVVSLDAIKEYQKTHDLQAVPSAVEQPQPEQAPTNSQSTEGAGAIAQPNMQSSGQGTPVQAGEPATAPPSSTQSAPAKSIDRPIQQSPGGAILPPSDQQAPNSSQQPMPTSGSQHDESPYVKNYR